MAEKQPSDDSPSSIKRNDDFRSEIIQGTAQQQALAAIAGFVKGCPTDQVSVTLKPADQRIALAIFNFRCFRQAAKAGSKTVAAALADPGENSDPCHSRRIRNCLHNSVEKRFNVGEPAKNTCQPKRGNGR